MNEHTVKNTRRKSVREVLRDQWAEFFQTFTSEHAGKLGRLGVDGIQPKHEIVESASEIESRNGQTTLTISVPV